MISGQYLLTEHPIHFLNPQATEIHLSALLHKVTHQPLSLPSYLRMQPKLTLGIVLDQ
jgi:hypothetical protein